MRSSSFYAHMSSMTNQMTRIDVILTSARRLRRIAVDDMAMQLGVSAHTVRRDINALCEQGKLRRLHGGAEYLDPDINLPYPVRSGLNLTAKQNIAAAAASCIPDDVTLFFSIGTTPALVATALSERKNLTVITCNLNVVAALSEAEGVRIILPGGELRLPDRDILSEDAIGLFENYRADFAIYGVAGIEEDGRLLDFHPEEVKIREAARANARSSLLVADVAKFGRRAACVGGRCADADRIIIDAMPGSDFEPMLTELKSKLVVTEGTD